MDVTGMAGLGPTEAIIVGMQLAFIGLPLLAWVYLYRTGAAARDMLFWGVVCIFVPIVGPIAAILYMRRRGKQKRQVAEGGL